MSDDVVRIGLVGYGFGGRTFHAPLIHTAANAELAGVVTRSPERRAEVAAAYPGVPVFDDLAALAESGAQAVAVSTPLSTHMQLVHEAIGLGLGVVCDKPVAFDATPAAEAVTAAERAGVPLTIYQNRRWDSDFLTVRRLVDDGRLGHVVRLESRFERFSPDKGPSASGGGLLRDIGAHLVDQAMVLLGPVTSVYAEGAVAGDPTDLSVLEERFFLALTHEGGATSHLGGDWGQGAPGPRFRVTGTAAAFVLAKTMDRQEPDLIAGRRPSDSGGPGWGAEDPGDFGVLCRGSVRETVPTEPGAWDTFYPAFADAVLGRGPLPVDPWESVAAARVLDAARSAAVSGTTVVL